MKQCVNREAVNERTASKNYLLHVQQTNSKRENFRKKIMSVDERIPLSVDRHFPSVHSVHEGKSKSKFRKKKSGFQHHD